MNLLDEFSIAIIFAALGALLLMAEVFFPSGGLIGLLAGCSFISAIYFAYSYGGLAGGLGFAAAEVILAPIAIYAGLQILPHTPMGKVLVGPSSNGRGSGAERSTPSSCWKSGRRPIETPSLRRR